MKILIVSYFFPPTNTMGALRVGHFTRYLISHGHDVRVVTAADVPRPQSLAIDVPESVVTRSAWADVNAPPRWAAKTVNRMRGRHDDTRDGDATTGSPPTAASNAPSTGKGMLRLLSDTYQDLTNIPDADVGWWPYAERAARRLTADWRPDIIFASAPPFTGLLVGHRASRHCGAPWVAEYRDRWVEDPYDPPAAWRLRLLERVERRILGDAAGIVTVSAPWAEEYTAKYGLPVEVVYNGYLPEQYAGESPGAVDSSELRIVYTGRIYVGRRDPSPLFEAIAKLGPRAGEVHVDFYGTLPEQVHPLAARFGVTDSVTVHPHLPHQESIRIQKHADILLLMQWNNPLERGNVPGKVFEYLGARRPILGLGLEEGVPARIIGERGAGHYANDPERIAGHLRDWLDEKQRNGHVAELPEAARAGYARDEQYERLERFLVDRAKETKA